MNSKLARDASGSLILKVASKALGFGVAVVLARTLGADGYGIYAVAFALVSLLALPAQVGLPTLLVRETALGLALEEPQLIRGVWSWAGRVTGVLTLVLVTGAAAVLLYMNDGNLDTESWTMAWAFFLIPLIALGNLRGAALRGLNRIIAGHLPEFILRPGLFLIFIGGLALFAEPLTVPTAMAMHVLAAALAFAVGAWLLVRHTPMAIRQAEPRSDSKAWLASTIPLALIQGLAVVNSHAGILILGLFEPSEEVGIYWVATQVAVVASFGLHAMNMAVAPRFARLYAQGETARLQRLVTGSARAVMVFSIVVSVMFIVFGSPALRLVFGTPFSAAYLPIVILLGGHLVNSTAGSVGYLLNMTGHERDTVRAIAVAAALNIVLNLVLIPVWGIAGAATASALSLATANVWLWWSARRRLGINSLAFESGKKAV